MTQCSFIKIKAKKRAFGFKCQISSAESVLNIAEILRYTRSLDPDVLVNYTKAEVKVYTDKEVVARTFENAFVERTK